MGDVVFVIISGEYSDWSIEGFAESEYEAIQICQEHNQKESYDDWYYCTAQRLNGPKAEIPLQYIHKFCAETKNGMLVLSDVEFVDAFAPEDECTIKAVTIEVTRNARRAWVCIPLKELNYEKARKIAQDKIAEYNYEHMQN